MYLEKWLEKLRWPLLIAIGCVASILLWQQALNPEFSRRPSSTPQNDCVHAIYRLHSSTPVVEPKLSLSKQKASPFGHGPMLEYKVDLNKSLSPKEVKTIRVGAYNVENLIRTDWVLDPETGKLEPIVRRKDPESKKGVAKAIEDMDLDLAILTEIGTRDVLEKFVKEYLNFKDFAIFHIKGNDQRGIHIAAILNKKIPLNIEWHSFRDFPGVYKERERNIFSRDFPIMLIRHPESDEPLAALGATHFKSMRGLKDDPNAAELRGLQAQATLEIKNMIKEKFGDIPYFMAGDFNRDLNEANEVTDALVKQGNLLNVFDHSLKPYKGNRATHTYHPRKNVTEAKQIDAILIDQTANDKKMVLDSNIYRYKDKNGKVKPLPTNNDERDTNPSDHFPIFMTVDFQKLIK